MITISLYLIFSRIRFFLKFPQTTYIYGFLLTLVTFINIFIFSLCDLSFFFFFLSAYIIAYLSRAVKNTSSLILAFFSMIIIFLPMFFTDFDSLKQILSYINNANGINNFFFALFLTPFILLMIRILVSKNLYKNHKISNYKKLFKVLIILCSVFVSLIIYSTVVGLVISKSEINSENILTYKIDNQGEYFKYNYIYEIS